MTVDRRLLAGFIRENPFQPATSLWRAVEVAFVAHRDLPDGRGLDVGSGDGRLIGLLQSELGKSLDVIGLDADELEVSAARASGHYARVHCSTADAIPEPSRSFDWVFSNSTLEHIGPIAETLAEVARVLRPGGTFIFTVPSADFHACLRGPRLGSRERYLRDIDERCAHLRYWGDEDWRVALQRAGMHLVSSESYLTRSEVRRWELISNLTAGVLHRVLRRPPISIQRQLRMRGGLRLPAWAALLTARVLAVGLSESRGSRRFGCRYYVARA